MIRVDLPEPATEETRALPCPPATQSITSCCSAVAFVMANQFDDEDCRVKFTAHPLVRRATWRLIAALKSVLEPLEEVEAAVEDDFPSGVGAVAVCTEIRASRELKPKGGDCH